MHLSDNGYNFLKSLEGYTNKPYKDSNGLYSVGLGHNGKDVKPNKIYTDEEIAEKYHFTPMDVVFDRVMKKLNQQDL